MQLIVKPVQRYAKQRSHTATHLLHAELGGIFPQTQQQWSLVESDYLRFDFNSDKFLTNEEISEIESNINDIILNWYDIDIKEMSMSEAEKLWAKMFFQDKYGDKVRVVSISSHNNITKPISIELCWWTHVANTREIGIFKIVSQESIASGIKRIIAYTWPKVIEYIQEKETIISQINDTLWTTTNQVIDKINKLMQNSKSIETKLNQVYQNWFDNNNTNKINISEISLLKDSLPKDLLQYIKGSNINRLIHDDDGSFIIYSPTGQAKQIWVWLKWWWNDQLFQWKDPLVKNINI